MIHLCIVVTGIIIIDINKLFLCCDITNIIYYTIYIIYRYYILPYYIYIYIYIYKNFQYILYLDLYS